MSSNEPSGEFGGLPLAEVLQRCQQALVQHRQAPDTDTSPCAEIVHRAADHDEEAIGVLISALSYPRIQIWRQSYLRNFNLSDDEIQDVQQEVAIRLTKRFRKRSKPYRAGTIAEYYRFLLVTTRRCALDLRGIRRMRPKRGATRPPTTPPEQTSGMPTNSEASDGSGRSEFTQNSDESALSLDSLRESAGFEPFEPSMDEDVMDRMRFRRLVELLPDVTMRTAFVRRFAYGDEPQAIADTLGLTRPEVFRLIERAIRILSTIEEVKDLFRT